VVELVVSVFEEEPEWLLQAEQKASAATVKKIPGFMV